MTSTAFPEGALALSSSWLGGPSTLGPSLQLSLASASTYASLTATSTASSQPLHFGCSTITGLRAGGSGVSPGTAATQLLRTTVSLTAPLKDTSLASLSSSASSAADDALRALATQGSSASTASAATGTPRAPSLLLSTLPSMLRVAAPSTANKDHQSATATATNATAGPAPSLRTLHATEAALLQVPTQTRATTALRPTKASTIGTISALRATPSLDSSMLQFGASTGSKRGRLSAPDSHPAGEQQQQQPAGVDVDTDLSLDSLQLHSFAEDGAASCEAAGVGPNPMRTATFASCDWYDPDAEVLTTSQLNVDKLALVNAVASSLVGRPDFFSKQDPTRKKLVRMVQILLPQEPEFVLKVALYTRLVLNIRTTANFLLALAASYPSTRGFLKRYFGKSIRLPSDWIHVAELYQVTALHIPPQRSKWRNVSLRCNASLRCVLLTAPVGKSTSRIQFKEV